MLTLEVRLHDGRVGRRIINLWGTHRPAKGLCQLLGCLHTSEVVDVLGGVWAKLRQLGCPGIIGFGPQIDCLAAYEERTVL